MTTPCPACQTPVSGKFCPNCGRAAGPAPGRGPWPWVGAALGAVVLFALGFLTGREARGPAAPADAEVPGASTAVTPPDISNMSPRERFDRLYDRVMRASTSGDGTTMQQFAPMAIAAYGMLDSVDIDAQYDVALLKLHTGDIAGARALGDSIVRKAPTHLFGQMLRATIARFQGDSAEARSAQAAFLRNYPEEMRRGRPEYEKHRSAIEAFKAQVTAKPSPAL